MVAAMSAAEREEHEGRALKLRKAMGENLGGDVEGEDVSARERRLNLIRCAGAPCTQALIHVCWGSVIFPHHRCRPELSCVSAVSGTEQSVSNAKQQPIGRHGHALQGCGGR